MIKSHARWWSDFRHLEACKILEIALLFRRILHARSDKNSPRHRTRSLISAYLASLPDEAEVTSRLLMNPDQIAALFRPAFGDQAAQTVSRLLTDHLVNGVEIMKAAKENDAEAAEDANRRWNENADAIAAALASLGPQFPEEDVRQMLYRHLDLTREELAARLAGDYQRDIDAFDAIEQQALMMGDALSQGIAQAAR